MVKNRYGSATTEKVSIIIINYKSEAPLFSCLNKIYKKPNIRKQLETIIINNGTGDLDLIKKISDISGVTLFDQNRNIGFAAGVNKGIMAAKNNLILLLNPDTLVTPDQINRLVRCLKENKAGIVGGTNHSFEKKRHNTYVRKPNIFTYLFDYTNLRKIIPGDYFHRRHYYLDDPFPTHKKTVAAVSGSFMLIDRRVINKIGLFDEKYFMYLEDIDYCLRANEAGFDVLFCPKSSIKHIGGYSSKNKERVHMDAWLKSRRYYVLKHEGLLVNMIVQPIFVIDTVFIRILQKFK